MNSTGELCIRTGRLFDAASGVDGPGCAVVRGDRIVSVGDDAPAEAGRVLEFPDGVLLPGLIDLHAHPAVSGSVFGVDPDAGLLARGTTTVLSQGDAGAEGIDDYVRTTIEASQTRVRLAINLSRIGESTGRGCFEVLDDADIDACVGAVERHDDVIWGIAVNVSNHACGGSDPREVLRRGLAAAERTGRPILYGMRRPEDWPLAEQLELLRPGDVVTYCFRWRPHCIVENGRMLDCVREARERGVLFDVGHGMASFSFEVAEAAITDGFVPDTISTDLQRAHVESGAVHDLPLVMSKLRAAGMADGDVFAAVTRRPAEILGLGDEIGTLAAGACADLTVLEEAEGVLADCDGVERRGVKWLPVLTMRAGEAVE